MSEPSSSKDSIENTVVIKVCKICRKTWDNEALYGEFLTYPPIHFHYFCLLSSSYIPQRCSIKTEIFGFKVADILKSISLFQDNICFICQKDRASIKCSKDGCKNYWHYPCGVNSCLTRFKDNFDSFCRYHVPDPNDGKKFTNESQECKVCYAPIGAYNPVSTLISSCCLQFPNYKIRFVHKKCVLNYTMNAGYDSMCITCDTIKREDRGIWQDEMRMKGVYVPQMVASWEDGRFDDQVKNKCTKPNCTNKGNHDVYTCYVCGCEPRHLRCVKVKKHIDYNCSKCFDQSFVKRVPLFEND